MGNAVLTIERKLFNSSISNLCARMVEMFEHELLKLIALSMMPAFEARAAIAYAIVFLNMNNIPLFVILTALSAIIGVTVYYFLLTGFETWIRKNGSYAKKVICTIYEKYIDHLRLRSRKYIEKYGFIGLTLFIAIPLPGSGVWTGALVAHIFNIEYRKAVPAIFIGAYLASTVSWVLTYFGIITYGFLIKP